MVALFVAFGDLTPADQAEVAVDFATERNLVVLVRTNVLRQQDARHFLHKSYLAYTNTYIGDLLHDAAARGGADVDEQGLTFLDVVDLVVAVVLGADDTLQESSFDVDLNVDLGHGVGVADDVAHHVV